MKPSVDSVVIAFNSDTHLLHRCLSSIVSASLASGNSGEIIIVDNASRTPVSELGVLGRNVRVVRSEVNLGFAAAANLGVRESSGDVCFLLNPDAEMASDGFEALYAAIQEHPDAIMNGLLLKGGDVQVDAYNIWMFSASRIGMRRRAARRLRDSLDESYLPVEKVCGGALFAVRSLLMALGPFDERFFLYGEDADLSLRARKSGVPLILATGLKVPHVGAASQKKFGVLVEAARADAAIRLCAYHSNRAVSWLQRLELLVVSLLGIVVGGRTSASKRARLSRVRSLRDWRLARDRPRFSPRVDDEREAAVNSMY